MDIQLAKQLSEKYHIETAFQKFNNLHVSGNPRIEHNDPHTIYISNTASKYVFILTKSNNNISVEFIWLTQPKNTVPVTNEILKCMIDHIGTANYGKKIISFTELRKGEQIS